MASAVSRRALLLDSGAGSMLVRPRVDRSMPRHEELLRASKLPRVDVLGTDNASPVRTTLKAERKAARRAEPRVSSRASKLPPLHREITASARLQPKTRRDKPIQARRCKDSGSPAIAASMTATGKPNLQAPHAADSDSVRAEDRDGAEASR